MEPDLFDHAMQSRMETEAPLAARMRPRDLDEFVGPVSYTHLRAHET